ncbi:hypothetical protein BDW42DRAFT_165809 [Aspergillus taichungensis]|uniref:F-box domain-containing protein n=1 Tax=Aspergillus taichungensis TaxID=482145 RepID=A0A2J5HZR3_9EURO|nr:hypothetical protein BDW42DRAFT_165809 [Aspergillus taichungensis]
MRLNQFPPELIKHILSYLPRSDLKAARLTCRALSGIATHWLYHSVYTRVTSFQNNVVRQEIEGLQELVSKFAPLVHSIDIDGGDGYCPFEVALFLDKLPALEKVSMRGVRTSWYHDQFFQGDFEKSMLRASLITPAENRILADLKSLSLHVEQDYGDWLLASLGIIFLIPQIQELTLDHIVLDHGDPKFPHSWSSSGLGHYSHQTGLKSLSITDSYIDLQALEEILSPPRTLTHLRLESRYPDCEELPDEWQEEPCNRDAIFRAISQQRLSLEKLDIRWEVKLQSLEGPSWTPVQFPRLRECKVIFERLDESHRIEINSGNENVGQL